MALQINRRKDEHFNKYFGTSGQQLKKKIRLTLLLSLKYISEQLIVKIHRVKIERVLELHRVKVFLLWIREFCLIILGVA